MNKILPEELEMLRYLKGKVIAYLSKISLE